jgi:hypothetical protein
MQATAPVVAEPSDGRDAVEPLAVAAPDVDVDQKQREADLQRLMDLADRYARHLVMAADSPLDVLLLVQHGDLEIVTLDGPRSDTRVLPRLLAQRQASMAVLLVDTDGTIDGRTDHRFSIVGETLDGLREERHYRVRSCGRTRRLTRLFDHDGNAVPSLAHRLFPPRTTPSPAVVNTRRSNDGQPG